MAFIPAGSAAPDAAAQAREKIAMIESVSIRFMSNLPHCILPEGDNRSGSAEFYVKDSVYELRLAAIEFSGVART
jgi:hypothetical protein